MVFPFKIIDLTHSLHSSIPTWDGDCGFAHHIHKDYRSEAEFQFRTHTIQMCEGIGTHIDAPAHCFKGAKTIADLDLNDLIVPCVIVNVSHKVHDKMIVTPEDIIEFEKVHRVIAAGSFVIINTGWAQFWGEPDRYHNGLIFPCLSEDTALLLLNREIVGLGVDTLSPDRPELGYPVHKLLLGSGKYIIENVMQADQLPPVGSYSMAMPMKIKDGTEAPIRLVGLIPR